MYNGWTPTEPVKPMEFPFDIPGYGVIQSYKGWDNFLAHYVGLVKSYNAAHRAAERLQDENETLKEQIEAMLLLETELA